MAKTSRKGEFVVVIGAGTSERSVDSEQLIDAGIARGDRATDIAREVARVTASRDPRSTPECSNGSAPVRLDQGA